MTLGRQWSKQESVSVMYKLVILAKLFLHVIIVEDIQ